MVHFSATVELHSRPPANSDGGKIGGSKLRTSIKGGERCGFVHEQIRKMCIKDTATLSLGIQILEL